MKKLAIIGSSGLIGTALIMHLKRFYEIVIIPGRSLYGTPDSISKDISGCHIIINLAGHSIAGRWTKGKKEKIENSRIVTTRNLVNSFSLLKTKPEHYINASGISIYKDGGVFDEASFEFAGNFLAEVVKKWENIALKAANYQVKTSIIRLGVVLSKDGGAYPEFRKLVGWFRVGALGTGNQGMSVIHIEDVVKAISFIVEKKINGIINLCLPEPSNNMEFMNSIATILKKPAYFRIPAFLMKIILMEGHILLTKGQKIYPRTLLKNGYLFSYPDIYECISKLEE